MSSVCRELREQRDEALEYADKLAQGPPEGMLPKDVEVLREANCGLAMELTAVTKERDRLADQIEANHKGTLVIERMLYEVREQRDRLAEELERVLEYQGRFAEEDPESIAAEALAAVEGGGGHE
jgi:DNA-directed RNA polymerase subunit F